jgi:hypothetical protein
MSMRKNDQSVVLQKIASGTQENLLTKTVVFGGKTWKGTDIVAAVQKQVAMIQATEAAHAAWIKAAGDEKTSYTDVIGPLVTALRGYIGVVYGVGSQVWLDLGFPPKRARNKPSAKTTTTAVEQRAATRKARGTLGKKQRLAIKGVTVTPVTAPEASAPSAASAPAATAASSSSPSGANGQSH